MKNPSRVTETDYNSIFNDISLRYKIPVSIIEKICMSQFQFLRDSIKNADRDDISTFKNTRLLGLGIFYFNHKLLNRFKILSERNKHEDTVKSSE